MIEGNYETYQVLIKAGLAQDAGRAAAGKNSGSKSLAARDNKESPTTSNDTTATKTAKRKRQFPYRKVPDLEHDIELCEGTIVELNAALIDPATLRNGQQIKTLRLQLDETEARLQQLYLHWEEAVELNG